VFVGDFLEAHRAGRLGGERFAVAITNRPFSLAQSFIEASLCYANRVVMLLRHNFLASRTRHELMTSRVPDDVLPNRPSFANGTTDSIEYAWFVWGQERRTRGTLCVLALNPKT
jgi:hypothetical protein